MVAYNTKMKRVVNPPPPKPHISTATSTPPPPKSSLPNIFPSSNTPSLGRVVAEGFAFGTGSAIARQVVNNTFGAMAIPSNTTSSEDKKKEYCKEMHSILEKCISSPSSSDCRDIFDQYYRQCSISTELHPSS